MHVGLKTAEWLQLASAVVAAAAATASWAAVRQARKIWRSRLLPELHVQALRVHYATTSKRVRYVVHNAGGGLAKGAGFVFVEGGGYVVGVLATGFMKPGETFYVETLLDPDDSEGPATGVVFCRDTDETSYAWNLRGERKVLRRETRRWWTPCEKPPPYHTAEDIFAKFFPAIELDSLEQEPAMVREPEITTREVPFGTGTRQAPS